MKLINSTRNVIKKINFQLLVVLLIGIILLLTLISIILNTKEESDSRFFSPNEVESLIKQVSKREYKIKENTVVINPDGSVLYTTSGYNPSAEELSAISDQLNIEEDKIIVFIDEFLHSPRSNANVNELNPSENYNPSVSELSGGNSEDKDELGS